MTPREDEATALYPSEIPIVSSLADVAPVLVAHTGLAVYSIDASGGRWVRKREENIGCEELLAEAIGWLFARRLDVPVPDAAFYRGPDGSSWLSGLVAPVVHWGASLASQIDNLSGLGAVLALDAIINNADRHSGNLLVQPLDEPLHVKVWAIDQGSALVGWPQTFREKGKEIPEISNLAKGIPIDLVGAHALEAAEKATHLSHQEIMSMVRGACLLTKETEASAIGETLAERCGDAKDLVAGYLERIRESSR